jgi:hypothetical protein
MNWKGGNLDTTPGPHIHGGKSERFDDERRRFKHDEVAAWRAGSKTTSSQPPRPKDFNGLRVCLLSSKKAKHPPHLAP